MDQNKQWFERYLTKAEVCKYDWAKVQRLENNLTNVLGPEHYLENDRKDILPKYDGWPELK